MGALRGWHIVVLLVVVLLLFGAPKLPELARSIGKSLHILKDEAKSLTSDDEDATVGGETPHPANPQDAAPRRTQAQSTQERNEAANASPPDVNGGSATGNTEARDS